eukprot:TRINITY_DN11242_c0_g1_i1.p1 TRINITY_DN11242_c0_g1~~TRINITY_DN11242_c0_g1_i1.p1  ORF type:complete len:249 (-),score=25.07 TRINITY_DN11242_c0_g1_i1:48-794(-)
MAEEDPKDNHIRVLLAQIDSMRDEQQHLRKALARSEAEVLRLTRELERYKPKDAPTPEPAAPVPQQPEPDAPAEAPRHLLQRRQFDPTHCGQSLELTPDSCTVSATNQYTKTVLVAGEFDSGSTQFIEFELNGPFARYTTVGVVRVPCATDLESCGLGEDCESYGYYGHPYWLVSLRHAEASFGPRCSVSWKPGTKVGVYVKNHTVSFYVDGARVINNGISLPPTNYCFAVGFGGVGEPGCISLLQPL